MVGRPHGTTLRMLRVASSGPVLVGTRGEPTRRQRYLDLSLGGMFIESLFPEEEGTRLRLDLQLEGRLLRLPAEVIWNRPVALSGERPAGMGVAFQRVTPAQKKLLYSKLATSVQQGQPKKSGTPPSRTAPANSKRGLRALLSRFLGDD